MIVQKYPICERSYFLQPINCNLLKEKLKLFKKTDLTYMELFVHCWVFLQEKQHFDP